MTGPEDYIVTEDGFQQDMRCIHCRFGKDGDRFQLAMEEGEAGTALSCTICGGLPDWIADVDPVFFRMAPIPVSVTIENDYVVITPLFFAGDAAPGMAVHQDTYDEWKAVTQ